MRRSERAEVHEMVNKHLRENPLMTKFLNSEVDIMRSQAQPITKPRIQRPCMETKTSLQRKALHAPKTTPNKNVPQKPQKIINQPPIIQQKEEPVTWNHILTEDTRIKVISHISLWFLANFSNFLELH